MNEGTSGYNLDDEQEKLAAENGKTELTEDQRSVQFAIEAIGEMKERADEMGSHKDSYLNLLKRIMSRLDYMRGFSTPTESTSIKSFHYIHPDFYESEGSIDKIGERLKIYGQIESIQIDRNYIKGQERPFATDITWSSLKQDEADSYSTQDVTIKSMDGQYYLTYRNQKWASIDLKRVSGFVSRDMLALEEAFGHSKFSRLLSSDFDPSDTKRATVETGGLSDEDDVYAVNEGTWVEPDIDFNNDFNALLNYFKIPE